jgi:hypothetical protein
MRRPTISRSDLLGYVRTSTFGTDFDNDRIAERLMSWARTADHFYVNSRTLTPLDYVGASKGSDTTVRWLIAFDVWVKRTARIRQRDEAELIARSNGLSVREAEGREILEFQRGIQVNVTD